MQRKWFVFNQSLHDFQWITVIASNVFQEYKARWAWSVRIPVCKRIRSNRSSTIWDKILDRSDWRKFFDKSGMPRNCCNFQILHRPFRLACRSNHLKKKPNIIYLRNFGQMLIDSLWSPASMTTVSSSSQRTKETTVKSSKTKPPNAFILLDGFSSEGTR